MAVPFCGSIIGGIWYIVMVIIGMMHMQKTTAWKSAIAYFLPPIVCCCLIGIVIGIIAMIFGTAFFEGFSNGFEDAIYNYASRFIMIQ